MERRAKIVATMGPACADEEVIEKMVEAGLNVARFNMSHGTHLEHKKMIAHVRSVRERMGVSLPIMIDTRGPEIRIGEFLDGSVELVDGEKFILTTVRCLGDENQVWVDFEKLPQVVEHGSKILLNDGALELVVETTSETEIYCKIVHGGSLMSRKSVCVPSVQINLPFLSAQDRLDVNFAVREDVDYLALSFVRSKEDVELVKTYLKKLGGKDIKIIAKIECQSALDNIDEIIESCTGIMIARGDLGVELPFEKIPQIQKELISKCVASGKLVITATQMLESMIENARPTRAEICDIANAILDGSGAVMLSAETSIGKHPALVVETMAKIIVECEKDHVNNLDVNNFTALSGDITASVAFGAYALAHSSNARAIIAVTRSGETAVQVSRFRPQITILGCTPEEKVFHQMGAVWGIIPVKQPEISFNDSLLLHARQIAKEKKIVKTGDLVIQTCGSLPDIHGSNTLQLNIV